MNLLGLFSKAQDVQEFQAGATIFEQGTPGDVMYVLLDGEVEVRVGGKAIDVIQPGDVLGEMALIDQEPRSASAVAKTNCRLAVVNERRFLFMVQQTPFFALELMRTLVSRLRKMDAARGSGN